MSAFDRYAPFVQDYIYRNHWENLRAIQVAAADAIFNATQGVEFFSIEDFAQKTKISKGIIETLEEMGAFGSIPKSNQLTFF